MTTTNNNDYTKSNVPEIDVYYNSEIIYAKTTPLQSTWTFESPADLCGYTSLMIYYRTGEFLRDAIKSLRKTGNDSMVEEMLMGRFNSYLIHIMKGNLNYKLARRWNSKVRKRRLKRINKLECWK